MSLKKNLSITKDYFYKKKVIVYQRRGGYRFSVDSPILSNFIPHCGAEGLEIGSGSGIISLLALYSDKFSKITGIEIQKDLAELATKNAKENHFSHRLKIVCGDFNKNFQTFEGISHIFSNPPFQKKTSGRLSPNIEIQKSKWEITLTIESLMQKAFSILNPGGNLYLILPFSRLNEILKLSKTVGFSPSRIRLIYSFPGGKPERFLIQLSTARVSLYLQDPLVIFKSEGQYTEEMEQILTGRP